MLSTMLPCFPSSCQYPLINIQDNAPSFFHAIGVDELCGLVHTYYLGIQRVFSPQFSSCERPKVISRPDARGDLFYLVTTAYVLCIRTCARTYRRSCIPDLDHILYIKCSDWYFITQESLKRFPCIPPEFPVPLYPNNPRWTDGRSGRAGLASDCPFESFKEGLDAHAFVSRLTKLRWDRRHQGDMNDLATFQC